MPKKGKVNCTKVPRALPQCNINLDPKVAPYICPRCMHVSPSPSALQKHFDRKIKCDVIAPEFLCDCLETFNNNDDFNTHKLQCEFFKKKQLIINNMRNKNTITRNESTDNSKSSFSQCKIHVGNVTEINTETNITKNNNVTNNIVINGSIVILPYASNPNSEYFGPKEVNLFFDKIHRGTDPYIAYIKVTYCYRHCSIYHSIYYPNITDESAQVFTPFGWIEKYIHHVIPIIIGEISRNLKKFIEKNIILIIFLFQII